MEKMNLRKKQGITLIALVVTIIVLLILAAIGISVLTGENGIIKNSREAKEQTEIDNEKEIVQLSTVQAVDEDKLGNITKEDLQNHLDNNTEKDKTKVYEEDEEYFLVEFVETKRVYKVDRDGNVTQEDSKILETDDTPGEFDGEGTQDNPFIIMSIEDLCFLAEDTTQNGNTYSGEYIQLGKTLNFKSELSYHDIETREYNEFLGVTDDVGLMEALTNEKYAGFEPIGIFEGTFQGNQYSLKNIYMNKGQDVGLFKELKGLVQNLEITGKILCNGDNAGGIAASGAYIQDCISRVDVKAGGSYVGGIVGGKNRGARITNCKSYGKIEGKDYVAGIQGYSGIIIDSENYGEIIGNWAVGGISGRYGQISGCKNYGNITAIADSAGGIIGGTAGGGNIVRKCINYGQVNSKKNAGGIVGGLGMAGNASAIDCINIGNVSATDSQAGGIAGGGNGFDYILNCYNSGNVTSANGAGGIVGTFEFIDSRRPGRVINCFSSGKIRWRKWSRSNSRNKNGIWNTVY